MTIALTLGIAIVPVCKFVVSGRQHIETFDSAILCLLNVNKILNLEYLCFYILFLYTSLHIVSFGQ